MKKTVARATVFALSLAASAAATTFSVSGPGGSIPDCPFSRGTWNIQPNWSTFTSSVFVSTPVASITKVRLSGLNHTFRGDVHVFLNDPSGNRFDVVVRPGFNGANFGDAGNYKVGTYDIVQSGGSPLNQGAVNISGGTYNNQFLNTAGRGRAAPTSSTTRRSTRSPGRQGPGPWRSSTGPPPTRARSRAGRWRVFSPESQDASKLGPRGRTGFSPRSPSHRVGGGGARRVLPMTVQEASWRLLSQEGARNTTVSPYIIKGFLK